MTKSQLSGFSILELLLVLVVIAAILFTFVNRYQVYRRERDVAIIRENVDLLYQALLLHYASNCKSTATYSVDFNSLNSPPYQALLNKITYIAVAPKNSYKVRAERMPSVTTSSPPVYRLIVTVDLIIPSTNDLNWYKQIFGAGAEVKGNTIQLTFNRLPSFGAPGLTNSSATMNSNLQYFKQVNAIPGAETSCGF